MRSVWASSGSKAAAPLRAIHFRSVASRRQSLPIVFHAALRSIGRKDSLWAACFSMTPATRLMSRRTGARSWPPVEARRDANSLTRSSRRPRPRSIGRRRPPARTELGSASRAVQYAAGSARYEYLYTTPRRAATAELQVRCTTHSHATWRRGAALGSADATATSTPAAQRGASRVARGSRSAA